VRDDYVSLTRRCWIDSSASHRLKRERHLCVREREKERGREYDTDTNVYTYGKNKSTL